MTDAARVRRSSARRRPAQRASPPPQRETHARPPQFPVSLVVAGRAVLVVGGGNVAARKAAALAECGAHVTVVAPDHVEAFAPLAAREGVRVVRRPYHRGEAAEYRLVVTATGVPEVDRAVAADADAAGIWVNSADDIEHCTFLMPSVHRDGPVTVAVSTGGASPALAAWLRRRIAGATGSVGALAELLADARGVLRAEGRRTSEVDWSGLLEGTLPSLVSEGRLDEARRLVEAAAGGVPAGGTLG